jgi:hypothetical protein
MPKSETPPAVEGAKVAQSLLELGRAIEQRAEGIRQELFRIASALEKRNALAEDRVRQERERLEAQTPRKATEEFP